MKNSTFNYVLKRVLVFLVIAVITMLFNACQVHAESYSLENTNTIARFYPSGTNSNLLWSTLYYNSNSNIVLSGWDFNMHLPINSTLDNILFNGRYLFSFYVFGVGTFRDLKCNEMTSNFKNINKTTGNMVQNEITSKCLDIYRTTYQGYNAYRFLYEFTYTSKTGPDGIDEVDFIFSSAYNPIVSIDSGMNYGFEVANINDYDLNIINTWNTDKSQQTIINQGQTQIQQNETIINQQNTNTTSIINNQEQNTQEIINNQNQNTQDMIESNLVCTNYDENNIVLDNRYLRNDGVLVNATVYGITDYIKIDKNSKITIVQSLNIADSLSSLCFYNDSKTLISCTLNNTFHSGDNVTIPNNASYIRYSIRKVTNKPQLQICRGGNQSLLDSLTDDSSPSLDALNNSAGWLPPGPVDSILNLPIALLNNLTTNLSKNCQPVILPVPYINQNITLPCVYSLYEQMGITTWVGLVGTIASALILFSYLAKLYKWVDDTLTFRENNSIDNWGGI